MHACMQSPLNHMCPDFTTYSAGMVQQAVKTEEDAEPAPESDAKDAVMGALIHCCFGSGALTTSLALV